MSVELTDFLQEYKKEYPSIRAYELKILEVLWCCRLNLNLFTATRPIFILVSRHTDFLQECKKNCNERFQLFEVHIILLHYKNLDKTNACYNVSKILVAACCFG